MPRGKITPHFSWGEARCNCGNCEGWGDLATQEEIRKTAEWMEEIRKLLGNHPIVPNSWYRCPHWNAAVGGAERSQHLLGKAVDFTMYEKTPYIVQRELLKVWGDSPKLVRGLGRYRGFTHVDRRDGRKAKWRKGY